MKQLTDHIEIKNELFNIREAGFETLALKIFRFQYDQNEFYRQYCDAIHVKKDAVQSLEQIPFLPIQFFKSKEITTGSFEPMAVFESSGTTGSVNSVHLVKDTGLYETSFLRSFEIFYGDIASYCIIGLLPSYLERKNSSLVWMVNELIKRSGHANSGFYLYEYEKLKELILQNENTGQPTLLIGVTYALLDFFELNPMELRHTTVMETGGMKGRREELTRSTVQQQLKVLAGITDVHAEYGMTELLSQAYSKKEGIFQCPPWMKILVRSEDDPFDVFLPQKINAPFINGVINVIDFANLYSCSFIATDDMGKLYKDGCFEILGRLDNSDVRGCSLMML
ncbi:MAG: acyl transferase [Ferruginibacter sp.]